MIKTAAILAAGLGSRLKDRTQYKPKGFLEIDGEALIIKSIHKLIEAGIERIVIGTGYLSQAYDDLALEYPQIECVKNDVYATSGSMCTLYCLRDVLKEDFLILESDLLYDKAGLVALIKAHDENLILSSGRTNSNDEVYIEVDSELNLVNMSKDVNRLGSVYSELVGITKVSYNFYQEMCRAFEKADNIRLEYEVGGLVSASAIITIKVLKIEDYAWCEIDDESHLERAINRVYGRIKEREMDNGI